MACLLLAGCNSADSQYPRAGILLTEEPAGARTVLEVREALLGPEGVAHHHASGEHAEHEHAEGTHAESPDDHQADDHQADDHQDTHSRPHEGAKSDGPAGPMEVVVVGQVGGLANPWQQTEPDFPFVEGVAKFFLADPGAVAEHQANGHHHAPGADCAFCASHTGDSSAMLAVVQFKDKQGQVLHRDARRWFTLKENETVVVHGQARIVAGGLLVVDADSLYVRR